MRDQSGQNPTPEAMKRVLQEAVLRGYPNPERRDCPAPEALRAAANRRLPDEDPVWPHVSHCSPCYREFLDMRATARERHRTVQALMALALAVAGVIVVVVLAIVSVVGPGSGSRPGPISRAEPSIPGKSPDTRMVTAVLNVQESPAPGTRGAAGNSDLQHVPRADLPPLLIYLPVGSETGEYRIEVRKENDRSPLVAFVGTAAISDGLTALRIHADLSQLPKGTYILLVSRQPATLWACRSVLA